MWRNSFILLLLICSCYSSTEQKDVSEDNSYWIPPTNSITNLYDAFGEEIEGLQKDFGFSCIINYRGKIILFDAGTNADIFKNNVKALKIDLTSIDLVVTSHAHFDHINGFDYLLEKNPDVEILFPFDPFWGSNFSFPLEGKEENITDSLDKKMQYFSGDYKGFIFNQSGRFYGANIDFINESTDLGNGLKLILNSSPFMGYFNSYPDSDPNSPGKIKKSGLKEISLSMETANGDVLIVGCSHSTVEKIARDNKAFTGNEIDLLYGGYHLLPYNRQSLNRIASKLKKEIGISRIAPTHCTGHLGFKILQNVYTDNYYYAGLGETVYFK